MTIRPGEATLSRVRKLVEGRLHRLPPVEDRFGHGCAAAWQDILDSLELHHEVLIEGEERAKPSTDPAVLVEWYRNDAAFHALVDSLVSRRMAGLELAPPLTNKTAWVAPGRGETAEVLLSLFGHGVPDCASPAFQIKTSLALVRPGAPLPYDLERAHEALRRVGVDVPRPFTAGDVEGL